MSTIVDADTGRVLGVVDGRGSGGVGAWLAARSQAWRDRVEVVAIDPSAAFRRALREHPLVAVSVDAFHLVKLANDVVTHVLQRVTRQVKDRRGRLVDPAWVNRRLLLRAGDTLSRRGLARLKATFAADDPTNEIAAAWAVKERLRHLLHASDLADLEQRRLLFDQAVTAAASRRPPGSPPPSRRGGRRSKSWPLPASPTPEPKQRTPPSNTSSAPDAATATVHHRARILLASAARTAA